MSTSLTCETESSAWSTAGTGKNSPTPCSSVPPVLKILHYLGHGGCLQNFTKKLKKNLHLWKIPVISHLRTNFAEMPGNRSDPGAASSKSFQKTQGRRGGESESLEEEDIEIGNS